MVTKTRKQIVAAPRRMTRRARKAHVAESLLNAVPDKTSLVLAYLETCEVLRMEGMNREWRAAARRGSLWTRIAFPRREAGRLDDAALARLLAKVDAGTHTKSLSLVGCTRLTGHASLVKIFGSPVLEELDMRVQGEGYVGALYGSLDLYLLTGFTLNTVGRSRSALRKVHFSRQRNASNVFGCYDDPLYSSAVRVAEATARRHRRDGTRCGECDKSICDAYPEFRDRDDDSNFDDSDEDIPWQLHSPACDKCGQFKCGHTSGSSCDWMGTCRMCRVTLCSRCDFMGKCDECNRQGCSACFDTTPCDQCNREFCTDCKFACFCDNCNTPYCEVYPRRLFCF